MNGWHIRRKGHPVWEKHDIVRNYLLGGQIWYDWPWVDVDYVYIPMNVESLQHWVLLILDLSILYDSMRGNEEHDTEVNKSCKAIAHYKKINLYLLIYV